MCRNWSASTATNIYRSNGTTLEDEKIYRVVLTNPTSAVIPIVKTGTCNLTSVAAYAIRNSANGQGSSSVVLFDTDLYENYVTGNDCVDFEMPIGLSQNNRDLTFTIPVHEKDGQSDADSGLSFKRAIQAKTPCIN